VLYKKSLANTRELFTYYLLYAFGILCQSETVDQMKVLQQQHFLSPAYKAAPKSNKPLFTAQIAIDYLTSECHTTNERTITGLERQLERVVRYNGETLFTFLNRFPALVNELEAAIGTPFQEEELTKLWKLNFSKHMNKTEKQAIKIDHADYVNPTEWASIKNFNKGIFDFAAMNKMLTQLCTTLVKWRPDPQVRQWNDQRKKDFSWDHEVEYNAEDIRKNTKRDYPDRNDNQSRGREKQARHKDRKRDRSNAPNSHKKKNRDEVRKSHDISRGPRARGNKKMNRKQGKSLLSSAKPAVPYGRQCKEKRCIEKGVQATHEWAHCNFRKQTSDKSESRSSKFSVSQKPFNKFGNKQVGLNRDNGGSKNSSSSFKSKSSTKSKFGSKDRKCWNCGDSGHMSTDCPKQKKVNHLLEQSQEFTCLLTEQFDTKELWECAQRIINVHSKPVCWKCCKPSCNENCSVSTDPLSAYMPEAHLIMSQNPDLGTSIQSAIQTVEQSQHSMVPLNHEMYYQPQEEQDDDSDDCAPMHLNMHAARDDSSSASENENFLQQKDEDPRSESESDQSEDQSENNYNNYHSDQEDVSSGDEKA
jgi:hypothetical protein